MNERRYHSKRIDNPHYALLAGLIDDCVERVCPQAESVVDVGSSVGEVLYHLEKLLRWTSLTGIDSSKYARKLWRPERGTLLQHDLSKNTEEYNSLRADLVICIEVAEHIQDWGLIVGLICRMTRPGSFMVFGAARPGQSGHGHVSCRKISEWIDTWQNHGWRVDYWETAQLHRGLGRYSDSDWDQRAPDYWLNACVYERVK